MFHKHKMVKTGERFNAPIRGVQSGKGEAEFMLRLAYGFTVVTYQCSKPDCEKVTFVTVVGRSADAV